MNRWGTGNTSEATPPAAVVLTRVERSGLLATLSCTNWIEES